MNERLLQFIWQFQYFNKRGLSVQNGDSLEIIHPGIYNTDQGPDFSQARVKIDKVQFAGSIELHLKTSDWSKHKHGDDSNYRNVILHVVWMHDTADSSLPLLVLQDRVSSILLDQYDHWMQQPSFIACQSRITEVNDLVWISWKQRLLTERMLHKSMRLKQLLEQNNYHWEETFWWILARNFGVKINSDAFEAIAKTIPVTILSKIKSRVHQIEALLMGQAGLLNRDFEEDYPTMLKKEYQFLLKKYKITHAGIPVYFLRMRPVNFPTIRLAQLAMLIHSRTNLFSSIREADSLQSVKLLFELCANDYWHYHFVFDESSSYHPKNIGEQLQTAIISNAICPMLFAYGEFTNNQQLKYRALRWMEELAPEHNRITSGFMERGVVNANAADSQALLELKTSYCDEKRCLDCALGNALLGKSMKM